MFFMKNCMYQLFKPTGTGKLHFNRPMFWDAIIPRKQFILAIKLHISKWRFVVQSSNVHEATLMKPPILGHRTISDATYVNHVLLQPTHMQAAISWQSNSTEGNVVTSFHPNKTGSSQPSAWQMQKGARHKIRFNQCRQISMLQRATRKTYRARLSNSETV